MGGGPVSNWTHRRLMKTRESSSKADQHSELMESPPYVNTKHTVRVSLADQCKSDLYVFLVIAAAEEMQGISSNFLKKFSRQGEFCLLCEYFIETQLRLFWHNQYSEDIQVSHPLVNKFLAWRNYWEKFPVFVFSEFPISLEMHFWIWSTALISRFQI